jgi:FtsZ-binding cell division protein ZapB
MNTPQLRPIRQCLLPSLFLAAVLGAEPAADPLGPGEKAAGDWIKVRLETSRTEGAWTTERPLLEATINGLKERAQTLEEKSELLRSTTAKDREEIATLEAKNKAAADDLRASESRLQALVGKLVELRPALPPRLSEALELPYRSLAGSGLGSGERMQLAMTVLNRCALFNRTVTCGDEVLTIDGDQGAKSLEVIYWGLSHGYALDRAGGKVWYGAPGPRGWQWEPKPDALGPVEKLIAVYNDKADPDFVAVPATLGQPAAQTPKN